jgi:hypothetical protein
MTICCAGVATVLQLVLGVGDDKLWQALAGVANQGKSRKNRNGTLDRCLDTTHDVFVILRTIELLLLALGLF